jgi:hypothetical protein
MGITREDVLTVTEVAALLDLKPHVRPSLRPGRMPRRAYSWRFLRPELEESIRQLPKQTD